MDTVLPKGWKWQKLGDVCDVVTGTTPPKSDSSNYGKDIPFFKPPHLWDGMITDTEEMLSLKGSEKARVVQPNTVLVTCIGNLGRTGFVKKVAAFNQQINAILENECIGGKFIFYQAQSPLFKKQLEKLATGTTVSIVNKGNFETIEIPLPPKPTQEAIVSKIEELFSELDKGIENLRLAQQQLKTYRQAVLKWAFEGSLTNENVKHDELPKGWKWMKLGGVAKKKSFKALPADYPDAKFIGMDCIEPHTLKPFFLYDFKEFKSAGNYFKTNQVLYGRMRPYLNKVYRAEFDGTCSGEFIILDCGEIFNPDLLKYILHSRGFVRFANSITTGDRPRISYEEISDYDIPLGPIDEQNKIVREIESRLSVADKMEESITQSLQQAEALRQSILKRAFEGKLI